MPRRHELFEPMKKRKPSSTRWLKEHANDHYVKLARAEGYRSRAAYKLLEIQAKDALFKPGMVVVDLGAAPGGWSQVVLKSMKGRGRIFALDRLAIAPLPGLECIQGDFTEASVLKTLLTALDGTPVDLVISDLAPNLSGVKHVDQPSSLYLMELALDFAKQVLTRDGQLLIKAFQGSGFEAFIKELRGCFRQVLTRKPKASRARSNEMYLLAKGYYDSNVDIN